MEQKFLEAYRAHVSRLLATLDKDFALSQAVGGNFVASGKLQFSLLLQLGMSPASSVADVGCGSGRLAAQLAAISGLKYTGTDIVPDLLAHATALCQRPDWSFHLSDGVTIPCPDESADFICFFSVLTHLKHEESYHYLTEAKRVLRKGGQIVISFLEFRIPSHWAVFDQMINERDPGQPLNQFMDRDGITVWAQHLGLLVTSIWDGGTPHIPLEGEVRWDDGRVQRGHGDIGHSVAVLAKSM